MSDSKHREPDLESPFLNEEIVGHIPGAPVAEAFGDDEVDVNDEEEDFSEEEEEAETLASEDEQEDEVVEECEEEDESTDDEDGPVAFMDSEVWADTADQIAFRDRVLAAHIARTKKRRGAAQRDLDGGELKNIPGSDIATLPGTAAAAGRLLEAARADLLSAQKAGDADALRTIALGTTSGYRGSAHQRRLWLGYFSAPTGYYDKSAAERERLPEGLHSDKALAYMLKPEKQGGFGLGGRIAAPGYSNHQGGIAIDFTQSRTKGHRVPNQTDRTSRARWRSTWFHRWLRANAATYGFKPIPTEEWHWEYRPARGIEGELTDAEMDVDSLTEQQVGAGSGAGAGVTVAPYGSYNLRSGGAAVRFWPMVPGSTVAGATAPAPPPPAVAPRFALVDVLIRPTEDPKVVTAIAAPNLLAQVTGPPPAQTMPLVPDAAGVSQICFAVPVAAGTTHFDGTLRVEIRRGTAAPGAAINVDLPLRVPAGGLTANLAVFFIVHTGLNRRYAWTKLRAESNVAPNAPIAGANVELNLLRDNSDRTFSRINRQIPLVTTASGFAAFNGRDVVGVSIGWPLMYKAAAAGFAPRGHMLRLAAANISDNLTPFVAAPPLRMLPSTVSLAGRRIMLDAGHGAVYALARFRRSQEWYVAHRIVDRIAEVLRTRHSVNAADILLTRTAGFALIDPAHIAIDDAPERGNRRFAFDLANRQVRIADNALGLLHVSNLVLTQHHAVTGAPQPVVAADRTRLLTVNATTVTAIETRLNNQLAPGQRVRPGSIRWDPATTRYIYIREPAAGGAGTDRPLPITTTDMWTLDDAMMNNLIDRSARWSLQSEIGTAATAQQIAGRPFTATARAAMRGAGALDYIRTKIRSYLPPNAAHAWATGGIMGWNLARRVQFFNANNCDLYVSVHANAAGGKGGMALVSNAAAGANVPPQDQIRLGKIALKYLDPFNQGLRQGGIAREIAGNATPPLQSGNTARGRYLYLEIEFMDAANPDNANQYRYEQMVETAFIDRTADQIVAAALEILLARQAGLDAIRLHNTFALW